MAEWTEAKKQRLRRLWADQTITVKAMGEGLGVTPLAISQQARRMGLPSRYSARTKRKGRAA
jgi:hypothetical protein